MQPVVGAHSHVSAFEDLLCTSRPGQNPRRAVQLSVPLRVDRHSQQALAPWNPRKIPICLKKRRGKSTVPSLDLNLRILLFWDFNPLQQPFAAGIGWPEPRSN